MKCGRCNWRENGNCSAIFFELNGGRELASTSKEELFELLVESSTGFAIFTTDANGLVTSWNIGAARLFGYSESEIMGGSADVIFTPEDRAEGAAENESRRPGLTAGRPMNDGTSEVMARDFGHRAFLCRLRAMQASSKLQAIGLSSTKPKIACGRARSAFVC
jgi:PAS domain S-box-containing protein